MEPGDRVPREHPLERVKELADAALAQLSPLFDEMYSLIGRPSIPPESSARTGNRASRPPTPATRRLTSTASAAARLHHTTARASATSTVEPSD
jgi:hypothetical protein